MKMKCCKEFIHIFSVNLCSTRTNITKNKKNSFAIITIDIHNITLYHIFFCKKKFKKITTKINKFVFLRKSAEYVLTGLSLAKTVGHVTTNSYTTNALDNS